MRKWAAMIIGEVRISAIESAAEPAAPTAESHPRAVVRVVASEGSLKDPEWIDYVDVFKLAGLPCNGRPRSDIQRLRFELEHFCGKQGVRNTVVNNRSIRQYLKTSVLEWVKTGRPNEMFGELAA